MYSLIYFHLFICFSNSESVFSSSWHFMDLRYSNIALLKHEKEHLRWPVDGSVTEGSGNKVMTECCLSPQLIWDYILFVRILSCRLSRMGGNAGDFYPTTQAFKFSCWESLMHADLLRSPWERIFFGGVGDGIREVISQNMRNCHWMMSSSAKVLSI